MLCTNETPFFLPPNSHNIYSCSSKTCFHERQWGWLLVVDFFTLHVPNLGFELRTCELAEGMRVGLSGEKTLALGASEL
jgi:hypothetical protein